MRKKVIAGNWKMNLTASAGAALARELAPKLNTDNAEVVFCVPFTDIAAVAEAVRDFNIGIGGQNMHPAESGAFTGEISAGMLMEQGAGYVIIGHSERRQLFAETDGSVNLKLKSALAAGLTPIVCVGERLDQRELGITEELLRTQVKIAFQGVEAADAVKTIVAYEPVWAIGTGKTATVDQARDACVAIRRVVVEIYDPDTAEAVRILYGGSVNAANAAELFHTPGIDGGLVGGASLKAEFADIVNCV